MKKISVQTKTILITATAGVVLSILNFLLLSSYVLGVVSISIIPSGFLLYRYKKYKENKEIEERFPDFLGDVAENTRTGMTIPQAINATKESNYGALTPYVKKMIVQVDWGVPFDKILLDFADRTSRSLRKIILSIIDTYRGGGNISDIFDSVGKSAVEINRINKERASMIYNQMITGYIIFFVFIGVIVMMQIYLVPSLQTFSIPDIGISNIEVISEFYSNIFRWLIVLQGFFSGLVIGKLSEGSMIAGLKHSLFLVILGSLILWIFI